MTTIWQDGTVTRVAPPPARTAATDRPSRRVRLAVLGITGAAALLYGWGLDRGGLHPFYTAAVRSMSLNWHNFIYGAFDPTGFITTDKLPGSYWAQALMVRQFGFHTWAVLLPSMLAATACVPLLFGAVRRWAGSRAGLLAAVIFALTPITAALAHTNIPDTYLVLFAVAGAYAFTRAIGDQRFRWLAVSAVLFGLAFQMKMLQGWLALPAFGLVYLICAQGSRSARIGRVLGFGALTMVISLSWMIFYSLTPSASRPAADGSAHGSIWEMVFVYNGVGRAPDETGGGNLGAAGPGPLRLFNQQVGGQISWLLPLALLALILGLAVTARAPRTDRLRAGYLLWGGWLLTYGAAISAASSIHPYYATSLAPAIAALAGAGLDLLIVAWAAGRARGWLLPLAVAITGGWAVLLLGRTPGYQPWLRPAVAVATALAVLVLLASLTRRMVRAGGAARIGGRRLGTLTVLVTAFAVLAAPSVWALSPLFGSGEGGMRAANAMAGPAQSGFGGMRGARGGAGVGAHVGTQGGGGLTQAQLDSRLAEFDRAGRGGGQGGGRGGFGGGVDQQLLDYLNTYRHGEKYLFATTSSMAASAYIEQGLPVLPMGGFSGGNPAPTVPQLEQMVSSGELRFVLDSRRGPGGGRRTGQRAGQGGAGGHQGGRGGRASGANDQQAQTDRAAWMRDHCSEVDPADYGGTQDGSGPTLYDCFGAG